MRSRLALVALAPLLHVSVVEAQAPGQWTPPPSPGAQAAPVAASPRTQRWSVGVSLGETELGSEHGPTMTFGGAAVAVRYRGWRHLELELSFGGGRERLADGHDGDLAIGTGTLAARYRFNPTRPWNWWLLAGAGSTVIAPHVSTEMERAAAHRPHVAIGAGLERRWDRFALHFELRALSLGPTVDERAPLQLGGGNFAAGASYYF